MIFQPHVEIQSQFAYCRYWSIFLACRQGQFKIYYLKVIIQKGKGWNSEVENVTVTTIICLNLRNMDTSNIYTLSLMNPICEIYLSFRTERSRYHQPFIYQNVYH